MANYQVVNQGPQAVSLPLDFDSPLRISPGQSLWVDARTLAGLSDGVDLQANQVIINDESGSQVSIDDVRHDPVLQQQDKGAAEFVAEVQGLISGIESSKIKDGNNLIVKLRDWIRKAEQGVLNVELEGEGVLKLLRSTTTKTISAGTIFRRVAYPMLGVFIFVYIFPLIGILTTPAKDRTILGVQLDFIAIVALFGTIGSLFRVLLTAATGAYRETDPRALSLIGLARPIMGGILALFIAALFASGIIALPVDDPKGTVEFLGSQVNSGKIAILALAFLAGVSDELVISLFRRAGAGVSGGNSGG